jgi:hypothetical protein
MSIKMLKSAAAGLVLSVSGLASASLIHNDLEWLDLSVTTGLTYNYVNENILTNSAYQDYRYATAFEVSELYNDFLIEQGGDNISNINQWHLATSPNTILATFFSTQYKVSNNGLLFTSDGKISLNAADYAQSILLYEGLTDNTVSYGRAGAFYANRTTTLLAMSELSTSNSLSLSATSPAQLARTYGRQDVRSLLVKQAHNVPEPSTLAIFALGMFGLASRRFNKQS